MYMTLEISILIFLALFLLALVSVIVYFIKRQEPDAVLFIVFILVVGPVLFFIGKIVLNQISHVDSETIQNIIDDAGAETLDFQREIVLEIMEVEGNVRQFRLDQWRAHLNKLTETRKEWERAQKIRDQANAVLDRARRAKEN